MLITPQLIKVDCCAQQHTTCADCLLLSSRPHRQRQLLILPTVCTYHTDLLWQCLAGLAMIEKRMTDMLSVQLDWWCALCRVRGTCSI